MIVERKTPNIGHLDCLGWQNQRSRARPTSHFQDPTLWFSLGAQKTATSFQGPIQGGYQNSWLVGSLCLCGLLGPNSLQPWNSDCLKSPGSKATLTRGTMHTPSSGLADRSTVDSQRLEYGCRVIFPGFPSSLGFGFGRQSYSNFLASTV